METECGTADTSTQSAHRSCDFVDYCFSFVVHCIFVLVLKNIFNVTDLTTQFRLNASPTNVDNGDTKVDIKYSK